jgi:hypothetical protein
VTSNLLRKRTASAIFVSRICKALSLSFEEREHPWRVTLARYSRRKRILACISVVRLRLMLVLQVFLRSYAQIVFFVFYSLRDFRAQGYGSRIVAWGGLQGLSEGF